MSSQFKMSDNFKWCVIDELHAYYKHQARYFAIHKDLPPLEPTDKVWVMVDLTTQVVVGIMFSRNNILIGGRSLIPGLGTWMLQQFPIGQESTVSIRNSTALNYLLKAGYRPVSTVDEHWNAEKKRRSWFLHFKKIL